MGNRDEVIIETELMKSTISRLISKTLKEKTGYGIEIRINKLNIVNQNEKIQVLLNVEAESSIEAMERLVDNIE